MIFAKPAYASCPVCIVTLGGGMIIAKKLGVDDVFASLWLSGLNSAISFFIAKKTTIKLIRSPIVFSFLMYLLSLWYFDFTNQIHPAGPKLFGIDKIILGLTSGFIGYVFASVLGHIIRQKNNGKVLFPYQRVVLPVGTLLLITLFFSFFV